MFNSDMVNGAPAEGPGESCANTKPFCLTSEQVGLMAEDNPNRMYIDEFEKDGEGRMYKGQWTRAKNRTKDGLGIQLWPDGSKYEGQWKQGKSNGYGRMTHANGDIYEGNWVNDKANGHGIFVDTSGARYEGAWRDN